MSIEEPPNKKTTSDNRQEAPIPFKERLNLARALLDAVKDRNDFIARQGGFDTFAEAGQYMGGMRESYDKLEEAVSEARKEFDEKVPDKKKFVGESASGNEKNLAELISSMFNVSE